MGERRWGGRRVPRFRRGAGRPPRRRLDDAGRLPVGGDRSTASGARDPPRHRRVVGSTVDLAFHGLRRPRDHLGDGRVLATTANGPRHDRPQALGERRDGCVGTMEPVGPGIAAWGARPWTRFVVRHYFDTTTRWNHMRWRYAKEHPRLAVFVSITADVCHAPITSPCDDTTADGTSGLARTALRYVGGSRRGRRAARTVGSGRRNSSVVDRRCTATVRRQRGNRCRTSGGRSGWTSRPERNRGGAPTSSPVVVEAGAGLPAEPAGRDHPPQSRRRRVRRLPELLEEHLRDLQDGVEADQIREAERAHRMVQAERDGGVDVLTGGEARVEQPDRGA